MGGSSQVFGSSSSIHGGFNLGLKDEIKLHVSSSQLEAHRHLLSDSENNEIRVPGKKEKKVRKPRYAFQIKSQVDILDDGYRWRKYGRKTINNNKFPIYAVIQGKNEAGGEDGNREEENGGKDGEGSKKDGGGSTEDAHTTCFL
ncbi:putative WRKY transcription factor 43 [Canna indica]|uniref:WRKY transcription factor 43 n=1 Tax=Canna indica TaxID=4628 RepID=A0AAQ3JQW7_9LILI|nr:putative WRKY transcription factor 43 [Canna indica]